MVRRARAAGLPVLVIGHEPEPEQTEPAEGVMPLASAPAPSEQLPLL
jgi:hypothetical protein